MCRQLVTGNKISKVLRRGWVRRKWDRYDMVAVDQSEVEESDHFETVN